MTEVKLLADRVPPLVQDIGVLAGLLQSRGRDLFFELDWFANAVAEIEAIPSRRAAVLKLLRDLLGTPAPNTPTNRHWYTFPYQGATTYVYVVLPRDDTTGPASTIGLGILQNFDAAPFRLQASLYVPLFNVPTGTPAAVTGSADHPIELALGIGLGTTVAAGGAKFDGLQFLGNVTFGTPPGFALAFTNLEPAGAQPTVSTLEELRSAAVAERLNAVLGVAGVKAWLNQGVGALPVTVGAVLAAAGIVERRDGTYTFGSLSGLAGRTSLQVAELLLARALQALAANDRAILTFGEGGIRVFATAAGTSTDYGLRLQLPDVDLSRPGGPSVRLQLGKLLGGDTERSSWISRSDPGGVFGGPGISLTLLREDAQGNPSFRPKLELVSIGVDVAGTAGNPLVDVNGVKLGSLEGRFLVSLDFAELAQVRWGVGLRVGGLGIPLGDGITGANANPVAQNLLSSGTASAAGAGGDREPVNPAFSAAVSRVFDPAHDTTLDVHLEQEGGSAETIWIPVQRAFGPLQCRRIGVQWPAKNPGRVLTFLFDGEVRVAALSVELQGLSLGIPLRTPGALDSYRVELQGLGVDFASGPLTITGGFLRNPAAAQAQYDGAALIRAAGFSISALGSYATTGREPSLFIFARIGAAFGGPPFFYVTGLCAGFGYNRSLRIPEQNQVAEFPLLAGIDDPAAIGGEAPTPAQALAKLADYVKVAQGVNWIAAGVQFTSFQLVKSNVVVAVVPTGDFQLAILGVSRVKLAQEGPQFAYAELGIRIVVQPSAGFFGASAVLSPNSYVIVPECHLTGGFAFFVWYAGENAGDFVVTLGGYHPAFVKPARYPDEPRLGFTWQVNPNLTLQGGAYFALTPSVAMGGGSLDVQFHRGNLRAWFRAHADFLFIWKPFYFIGSVGVSVGASYKLDLLFTSVTLSVELGAELELWGPPTGGRVHVSWFVISFTVPFGAPLRPAPGYLSWNEFATLLPQNDRPRRQAKAAAKQAAAAPLENVVKASLAAGGAGTDGDSWLVRADALAFGVSTAFPLTRVELAGATPAAFTPGTPDYFVAVRPMGISGVASVLTLTVTGPDGVVEDLGGGWSWAPSLLSVPVATWGHPLPEGKTPATPSAESLPNRLVGVQGLRPKAEPPTGPGPIPLANLALFPIDQGNSDFLPLAAGEPPAGRPPRPSSTSLQVIADTIAAPAITAARAGIFAALAGFGYDAGTDGSTAEIAANVNLDYPDAPLLRAPGQGAAA